MVIGSIQLAELQRHLGIPVTFSVQGVSHTQEALQKLKGSTMLRLYKEAQHQGLEEFCEAIAEYLKTSTMAIEKKSLFCVAQLKHQVRNDQLQAAVSTAQLVGLTYSFNGKLYDVLLDLYFKIFAPAKSVDLQSTPVASQVLESIFRLTLYDFEHYEQKAFSILSSLVSLHGDSALDELLSEFLRKKLPLKFIAHNLVPMGVFWNEGPVAAAVERLLGCKAHELHYAYSNILLAVS